MEKKQPSKTTYQVAVLAAAIIIALNDTNTRKEASEEADSQLTESIRQHGILQPLGVRPAGERWNLVWGFRRFRCGLAAGLTEFPVVLLHKDMTEGEYVTLQMLENVQRESLSQWDMYQGCLRLQDAHPGKQAQELAKLLSMSPGMWSKWISPAKTIPAVQAAFKEGKLTLSATYDISKVPHEQQAGLLALRLGGASTEQMAEAAKPKPANKSKPRTMLKVSLALQGGAMVAVSAQGELTTAELLKIIDEAREAVKKADKEHLDVDTLAQVMANKARVKEQP